MTDLTGYLSSSIENIVRDSLKIVAKNPREFLFLSGFSRASKKAARKRKAMEANGCHIPPFLIASIAQECNLRCVGCYASVNNPCTSKSDQLSDERWNEIFSEAQELGVSFIMLAGGEPLMRPGVLEKAAKLKKIAFPVFTNGTLVDDKWLAFFNQHRNLIPILSIEGDQETTDERRGGGVYRKVSELMKKLKKSNIFFGVSITVTKKNLAQVTDETFVPFLADSGCSVAFYVEYVPADRVSMSIAPTDEDRECLYGKITEFKKTLNSMIVIAFPGDEEEFGGCLASGRGFFHINANGSVEPCPFSPYSDMSLKEATILEALQSPLFKKLRSSEVLQAPHSGGCVLFENEDIVKELLQ